MDIEWNVSRDYSTYFSFFEGETWIVHAPAVGNYFEFYLYGPGFFGLKLPTRGGLRLAISYAEMYMTKNLPEDLAKTSQA